MELVFAFFEKRIALGGYPSHRRELSFLRGKSLSWWGLWLGPQTTEKKWHCCWDNARALSGASWSSIPGFGLFLAGLVHCYKIMIMKITEAEYELIIL